LQAVKKPVSITTISKMTGVSIATVSRVINNNGRFSKRTRDIVQSAICENGYVPNALARGLRKKRMQNIGIIVPDITNEFFANITRYIQKALFEADYSTLIYDTDENADLELRHLQNLAAQNVSAIIFIAGGGEDHYKNYELPPVPIIFLDRKPPDTSSRKDYISIHTDNYKGGYLAGTALKESGCNNPALVMDKRQIHTQLDRLHGFEKALSESRIKLKSSAIYKMPSIDCNTAYTAISGALAKGKSYDSYFCTTDWLAIGAMTALLEHNILIPGQARIVGFDNISTANHCRVPLTTIHQDIKGMSNLAVKIILDILNGKEVKEKEFVFEPVLVKRQSA